MDRQPDAVAEPVAEVPAEAGGLDRLARERVGLDAGQPGLDPGDRSLLRREADVVDLAELLRQDAAGREGAGAVAAVAVDPRRPSRS